MPEMNALLSELVQAVRDQDWQQLSQINRQIDQRLRQQPDCPAEQRDTLRQVYQTCLQQCDQQAGQLWQKIQNTLEQREAMAAYACFADNESFGERSV